MASATGNIIKLGFLLSATDKMSQVVDKAFVSSLKSLNSFERTTAKIGQKATKFGGLMTAMGYSISESTFNIAQKTAGYAKEMQAASQRIGVGIKDFSALAFAAEKSGISVESFETAMKGLNKKIVEVRQGGKGASTVFKDLGVKIGEPKDMLIQLAEQFAKYPDGAGKASTATEIFGKAGAELIPLLNKGGAGIDELMKRAAELGFVLDDEAIKASNEFNKSLGDLQDKVKGAGVHLGLAFMPTVTKAIEKIKEITERVVSWAKANPELIGKVIKVTTVVTGLLLGCGAFLLTVGTLIKSVLLFTKIFSITATVVKGGIIAFKMGAALIRGMSGATALLNGTQKAYIVWQKLAAAATWLFNTSLFGCPIVWIILGIAAVVAAVVLLVKKWDAVSAFFKRLWDGIKKVFSSAWEWIKNIFLNYHPVGLVIKHWDTIKAWFSGLWDSVTGVFSNAWEGIKNVFLNLSPVQWLIEMFASVDAWFTDLVARFREWGANLITGLIDGVKSMFTDAVDSIGNLGRVIGNTFKGILGIASPSKVFAEYGLNITRGLTGGIEQGEGGAIGATEGLAMQTVRAAGSSVAGNSTSVSNMENSTFGGAVSYAPVINISGGGGSDLKESIMQALQRDKAAFARFLESILADKQRLAFVLA